MLREWRAASIVVLVTAGGVLMLSTRIQGRRPVDGVQQPPAQAAARVRSTVAPDRALLDRYCVGCHSERLKTGGLVLENLNLAHAGSHAEILEKVLMKIRAGAFSVERNTPQSTITWVCLPPWKKVSRKQSPSPWQYMRTRT